MRKLICPLCNKPHYTAAPLELLVNDKCECGQELEETEETSESDQFQDTSTSDA